MRGCEALQRAQPASAMAVLPASAFGALCLCFVFVMQPGRATLVFHHKTGGWLNDGERLLGGERVPRASRRDGSQKPKLRRVGAAWPVDSCPLSLQPASAFSAW